RITDNGGQRHQTYPGQQSRPEPQPVGTFPLQDQLRPPVHIGWQDHQYAVQQGNAPPVKKKYRHSQVPQVNPGTSRTHGKLLSPPEERSLRVIVAAYKMNFL